MKEFYGDTCRRQKPPVNHLKPFNPLIIGTNCKLFRDGNDIEKAQAMAAQKIFE